MLRENGEVNEAIAELAKRAGARRLVLLSASSATKWGYGGALEGGTRGTQLASVRPLCGGLDEPACPPAGRAAARGVAAARHCSPPLQPPTPPSHASLPRLPPTPPSQARSRGTSTARCA